MFFYSVCRSNRKYGASRVVLQNQGKMLRVWTKKTTL